MLKKTHLYIAAEECLINPPFLPEPDHNPLFHVSQLRCVCPFMLPVCVCWDFRVRARVCEENLKNTVVQMSRGRTSTEHLLCTEFFCVCALWV